MSILIYLPRLIYYTNQIRKTYSRHKVSKQTFLSTYIHSAMDLVFTIFVQINCLILPAQNSFISLICHPSVQEYPKVLIKHRSLSSEVSNIHYIHQNSPLKYNMDVSVCYIISPLFICSCNYYIQYNNIWWKEGSFLPGELQVSNSLSGLLCSYCSSNILYTIAMWGKIGWPLIFRLSFWQNEWASVMTFINCRFITGCRLIVIKSQFLLPKS
jgi:hypothetical protein